MVAPPPQMGERLLPARARPVPFCFQGFLPPPRTSPRVFVEWVPRRLLALMATMTSFTACRPLSPSKVGNPANSSSREVVPSGVNTLSFIGYFLRLFRLY